jgi:hypothetical protein
MTRVLCVLVICLVPAVPGFAQSVEIDHEAIRTTRIITAIKITERITLDGRFDEPTWAQAPAVGEFVQKLPNNDASASERTEARFVYDDDNLYIGVVCFDSQQTNCSSGISERF